jgi:cytochrome c oxidase assembly protein subunit 15
MKGLVGRLPDHADRRVRAFAWISVAVQLVNVLSGAAVRLTGSGLGCPTFPECTPGSLVVTPEMGIHGAIEFGNRMVAVVLTAVCIVMFVLVVRLRRSRPELFWLALAIGLGIPAEAVIGGMSVLSGLNPYVVGLHFVVSVVLIVLSTALLYRAHDAPGPRERVAPAGLSALVAVTAFVTAVTVLIGIATTGAGPHAGDATAPRNGLNPGLMEHVHSYPAYLMFALTVLLLWLSWRLDLARTTRLAALLTGIELVQIAVGIAQSRLGLPGLLVGVHMILACLVAIAMTALWLSLRAPSRVSAAQNQSSGSIPTATKSTVR